MARVKTSPGKMLEQFYMDKLSIKTSSLASVLQISETQLDDLLAGRLVVTEEIADGLARIFQTTRQMWLTVEKNYRTSLAVQHP